MSRIFDAKKETEEINSSIALKGNQTAVRDRSRQSLEGPVSYSCAPGSQLRAVKRQRHVPTSWAIPRGLFYQASASRVSGLPEETMHAPTASMRFARQAVGIFSVPRRPRTKCQDATNPTPYGYIPAPNVCYPATLKGSQIPRLWAGTDCPSKRDKAERPASPRAGCFLTVLCSLVLSSCRCTAACGRSDWSSAPLRSSPPPGRSLWPSRCRRLPVPSHHRHYTRMENTRLGGVKQSNSVVYKDTLVSVFGVAPDAFPSAILACDWQSPGRFLGVFDCLFCGRVAAGE